jgi:hypothetical protein
MLFDIAHSCSQLLSRASGDAPHQFAYQAKRMRTSLQVKMVNLQEFHRGALPGHRRSAEPAAGTPANPIMTR